jgi:hypothetical protein
MRVEETVPSTARHGAERPSGGGALRRMDCGELTAPVRVSSSVHRAGSSQAPTVQARESHRFGSSARSLGEQHQAL